MLDDEYYTLETKLGLDHPEEPPTIIAILDSELQTIETRLSIGTFTWDDSDLVFNDHRMIYNRSAENSHPISAITGLSSELSSLPTDGRLTNEEIEELWN